MPFAAVNGQRLAYDDTGGSGPVIVFSHGFLMDRSMFVHQVAALREQYRVVTWDERGFGDTVWDGAPFTYWDSAADVLGLLDHLGVERAVLAGMSQGGFLSLRAALTAPDRVRALVLLDSGADVDHPEVLAGYQGMIDTWVTVGPVDELAQGVAGIILGDEALAATWIAKWKARDHAALREPGATLVGRDDVSGRLGEIGCPALVVHGSADVAITLDRAEAMAAALAGAGPVVVVEGAAHAANLTHPEPVNAAIASFLAGLPD
jgi:3-oxoadipate enol-lactonase